MRPRPVDHAGIARWMRVGDVWWALDDADEIVYTFGVSEVGRALAGESTCRPELDQIIRAAFAPVRIVREEPRLWRKLARLALTSAGYVALCTGRRVRDVGHVLVETGSRIGETR